MTNAPLVPYLSLGVVLLVSLGLALLIVGVSSVLGPRRPSAIKSTQFECGSPVLGDARGRFAIKFYVVALLFIVFDIEAVVLFPWAVNFQRLGWFGYTQMLVFVAILSFALIYVWKKGALEWET